MSDFAAMRTKLYDATVLHRDALDAYTQKRDPLAADLRGTKASLSEADKYALQQRMAIEHPDLVLALTVAEREKAIAERDFEIADDAGKNWRREMDRTTAETWRAISLMQHDTAERWIGISERLMMAARYSEDIGTAIANTRTFPLHTLDTPAPYTVNGEPGDDRTT